MSRALEFRLERGGRRRAARWLMWLCLALAWSGCDSREEPRTPAIQDEAPDEVLADPREVAVEPAPGAMRRLTQAQYRTILHDVFGPALVVPVALEPDTEVGGLVELGAAESTISPRGVEQYEKAAYDVAEQVMADGAMRAAAVPCQPAGVVDEACARGFVRALGPRLWRRPLAEDEEMRLVAIAGRAAQVRGDFHRGLEFALAALLQSPSFLYRIEVGHPGEGGQELTGWELATRLSFFLWNTTPDAALLAAAADGSLETPEGLEAQARRLLESPRAREGVRTFFSQMLGLHHLDEMTKDPTVFTQYSAELGPAAREETLLGIEHLVFELDGDYRELLTTRRTFVDRRLAALYGVRAPVREGFGMTELPEDGPRRGLLGQASVLALRAHSVDSSATLRGIFVREILLCQPVPPPPSNVDTSIPEPSGTTLTLRERVAEHLENENCRGCHLLVDPIGLGLENFDGIGRYRDRDRGRLIDASGELDGVFFGGPQELAEVLHDHEALGSCLVRRVYRFATGHQERGGEQALMRALAENFAADGYRVKGLLLEVVMSPGFRQVSEPIVEDTQEDR